MSIEDAVSANERILDAALEQVNSNIASLVARLADDGNGRFLSDSISLQQALDTRIEIAKAMQPYNDAVTQVTDTYIEAARNAAAEAAALGIPVAFTQADADLIDAMVSGTRQQLISAGIDLSGRISEQLYLSVAAGGNKADMVEIIRQGVIGKTTKRGKPLANHAKTLAQDAYMNMDSVVTMRIADNNGLDRFIYKGSLVRDSRQWCKDHVNRVFTREEIEAWAGQSWQGKAPGDPFVVRAGYNCQHHWRIVVGK